MTDLEPLARFGAWVLQITYGEGIGLGCDIQEEAERRGLVKWFNAAGPCGEDCKCAQWTDVWPVECRRYTEATKAALAALRPTVHERGEG